MQTFIQLPDDGGNTGKKVAAISRTQGSDTVYDHVFALNRSPISPLYAEATIPSEVETLLLSSSFVTTTVQTIVVTGGQFRFRIKLGGVTFATLRTSPASPTVVLPVGDSGQIVTGTISVTAYHEESTPQLAQVTLFGYTVS